MKAIRLRSRVLAGIGIVLVIVGAFLPWLSFVGLLLVPFALYGGILGGVVITLGGARMLTDNAGSRSDRWAILVGGLIAGTVVAGLAIDAYLLEQGRDVGPLNQTVSGVLYGGGLFTLGLAALSIRLVSGQWDRTRGLGTVFAGIAVVAISGAVILPALVAFPSHRRPDYGIHAEYGVFVTLAGGLLLVVAGFLAARRTSRDQAFAGRPFVLGGTGLATIGILSSMLVCLPNTLSKLAYMSMSRCYGPYFYKTTEQFTLLESAYGNPILSRVPFLLALFLVSALGMLVWTDGLNPRRAWGARVLGLGLLGLYVFQLLAHAGLLLFGGQNTVIAQDPLLHGFLVSVDLHLVVIGGGLFLVGGRSW